MDVVDEAGEQTGKVERDTMPWVEKYRPQNLNELIAHEEIIQILNKLIESNKLPHLLFYGPPGTGWVSLFFMLEACLTVCILLLLRQNFDHYGLRQENVWQELFVHDSGAQCFR